MKKKRGLAITPQRANWDCGVASLSTLYSLPYEQVCAASRIIPARLRSKRGLCLSDMQKIARKLGRPLSRVNRARGYLLNATGILGLVGPAMHWSGHWVVLQNNNIIDPDGAGGSAESWPVLDYLAAHDARPCTLLVEDQ